MVYGDRLRQARVLRHEKLGEVATSLECAPSTLSKWENSETVEISNEHLDRLSKKLRFPPEFFFDIPKQKLADSDLLFKAPKSTLKREKDFLREFMRFTAELIDWLDSRRKLPPVAIRPRITEIASIAQVACSVRESLGLSKHQPIDYLTHPIERAGIVVVVRRRRINEMADESESSTPLERHEGCSTWIGEFGERPLIMMRSVTSWEKTRWVLGHELGHLVLHSGRLPVTDSAEEEASQFASELLAPIEVVSKELPRAVTLTALIDIKMKWGISLAALIRHLHQNKVISDQRKQTLYDQLYTRRNPETGRSYGVTEPGWDSRTPERPRLIAAWLGHTVGSIIPEAVSHTIGKWPSDLLSEVIAEQRSAPGSVRFKTKERASQSKSGQVIPMPIRNRESYGKAK